MNGRQHFIGTIEWYEVNRLIAGCNMDIFKELCVDQSRQFSNIYYDRFILRLA